MVGGGSFKCMELPFRDLESPDSVCLRDHREGGALWAEGQDSHRKGHLLDGVLLWRNTEATSPAGGSLPGGTPEEMVEADTWPWPLEVMAATSMV